MEKKYVYVIVAEYSWFDGIDMQENGTRIDAVCETLETAEAYVEVLIGKYCDNYRGIDVCGNECTFKFERIDRTDRDICLMGKLVGDIVVYHIDCSIIIRIDEIELFR